MFLSASDGLTFKKSDDTSYNPCHFDEFSKERIKSIFSNRKN